jgi:hypothetical protein
MLHTGRPEDRAPAHPFKTSASRLIDMSRPRHAAFCRAASRWRGARGCQGCLQDCAPQGLAIKYHLFCLSVYVYPGAVAAVGVHLYLFRLDRYGWQLSVPTGVIAVVLDLFIDPVAVAAGYWVWLVHGTVYYGIPLLNYSV